MYRKLFVILAILLLTSFVVYKSKAVSPIPDVLETKQEEVLSSADSNYRDDLVKIMNDFSLKFVKQTQNSVKYQNEEITHEEFLTSIKDLHESVKETESKIILLRTPPEDMKEGVEKVFSGLHKLKSVTQTILDFSEGKVPKEEIDKSESIFFEAMYDFDNAEEMLGIEIERGQI